MREPLRYWRVWVCVLAVAWQRVDLVAVDTFDFGFELESAFVSELDETSTITAPVGDSVPFSIWLDLGLASTDNPSADVQGWSFGVWTSGFEIESVSDEGTLAELPNRGGIRDPESNFFVFNIADPDAHEGRQGVYQAVVLSFFTATPLLPVGQRYRLGRIDCRATLEEVPHQGFMRYDERFRNPPSPAVAVNLTVDGENTPVGTEHRDIAIGQDSPVEICDDGVDNDGDGFADLDDPDCIDPLPREVCDDGIDNDGDGATDCDDSMCIGHAACPAREVCDDGIDNERDGAADCDDADCEGHPSCLARELCDDGIDNDGDALVDCEDRDCGGVDPCPVIERCFDFRDNDGDGLLDCDDPDCVGIAVCGLFELCADGEDNNADGLVDCEDPQCERGPSCTVVEDCDDGLDNDEDGLVDCDDIDCRGRGDCPGPENCRDGLDNDQDGLVDCLDSDCVDRCRVEVCDDGADNDFDGLADCDDADCAGRDGCVSERCGNGLDDDGDGLVDCEDPACVFRAPCAEEGAGFNLVLAAAGAQLLAGGVPGDGAVAGPVEGQPRGFRNVLELSADDPDTVEVTAFISPFPVAQSRGAQGWSVSVVHPDELLDIVAGPTIAGTDAEAVIVAPFFDVTVEVVAPEDGEGAVAGGQADEGAAGVISAVVLSFTAPATLDPTIPQSVLRTTYRVSSAADAATPAVIRFQDGLRSGPSPGVVNSITIEGNSVEPVHEIPLVIARAAGSSRFLRGDANGDGRLHIADAVRMIHSLIRRGPPSPCPSAADANGDGRASFMDPVYLVQFLFRRGPPPSAPFPDCGERDADIDLPCPSGTQPSCGL